MTQNDYLQKLLSLCTEKQKDLFNRIYPDGPTKTQVKHAIFQVENTLKNLNATQEEVISVKKEIKSVKSELTAEIQTVERKLSEAERDLKDSNSLIIKLKNPINIENAEVQERLDLLDRLEAGGVDNWDGYDWAVSFEEFT